jgi:predicted dehydrogenase
VATTRFGIVGCGRMGQKHAKSVVETDSGRVTAVADADAERARALASDVGARVYPDVRRLLAAGEVDAVIVATPPRVRQEVILPIVEARLPLFVEKPPAFDLPEARECARAIVRQGVLASVGFMLRYQPMTERARELLVGRRITLVRTMCTIGYYLHLQMPLWFLQKDQSGGPLCEQAIHVLDAARYLVGDVTQVFARGDRLVRPDVREVDAEDTLVLAYRFANGALGVHSHSCAIEKFRFEVECLGADCRLLLDYGDRRLTGLFGAEIVEESFPPFDAHRAEIVAFARAVRGEEDARGPLVRSSYADAVRTLAFTLAGNDSLATAAWETVEVD